ncbi:MAG: M24 family metallopeptidase, partial [Methanobacteriota archaeon]
MRKLDTALQYLNEKNIECGIVLKPENIFYLSGFFPSSRAALLLKQEPLLLVSRMDAKLASAGCVEFKVFEKLEKELKLEYRNIGIEKNYANIKFYEKYLAGKNIQDLNFIEEMRKIKGREEIEKIKKAIKIAGDALVEATNAMEGKTEREVAAMAEYAIKKRAGAAFEAIVASGKNSSIPHHMPSDKKIKPDEAVIIDIGAKVGYYNSDISRTLNSNPDIYGAVIEAQRAGIKECYAGNEINSADSAVRSVLREYALEEFFLHSS